MICAYCSHDNRTERPTCGRCGSDLPVPTCGECGASVAWSASTCWRCESLGSDTGRTAIGTSWQVHGIDTPVLGRTREVHVLNELLKSAIEERRPMACTVVADTGMGKTRLVDEFNGQLDKHFDVVTVARGECKEDHGPPYLLWGRVLRSRFYIGSGEEAEMARRKLQDGLAAITHPDKVEECAHLLGHMVGLPFPDSPWVEPLKDSPQKLEARAYQALVHFLTRDAHKAPFVLVLEDLHLAGRESLNLVSFLLQENIDAPLLILCTALPTLADEPPAYWQVQGSAHTRVDLSPLSDDEVARLLQHIFRQAGKLPSELTDLAAHRALGNPFTVETIARILLERGVIETGPEDWTIRMDRLDADAIPATRDGVVEARLAELTDHERHVLSKAAVIGDAFWYGALVMLDRLDGDDWPEEDRHWNSTRSDDTLSRVLRSLRNKDIIRRTPTCRFPGEREFVFKHGLERKALYPPPDEQRERMHRMVAQWLEIQSSEDAGRRPIEDIARHYERAGMRTKAAYYHIHGGHIAAERFLNPTAIELFTHGLECLGDSDAVVRIETLIRRRSPGHPARARPESSHPRFRGDVAAKVHPDPGAGRYRCPRRPRGRRG